jgi:hypothetical protein
MGVAGAFAGYTHTARWNTGPHRLRVVFEAEGHNNAATLSFGHRAARDAAYRHYEEARS